MNLSCDLNILFEVKQKKQVFCLKQILMRVEQLLQIRSKLAIKKSHLGAPAPFIPNKLLKLLLTK